MRSTRASAAVERLKARSGNDSYSMAVTPDGRFYLMGTSDDTPPKKLTELLSLDEFVIEVNKLGPQKAKRVSKFDVAFEKQLVKKDSPSTDDSN